MWLRSLALSHTTWGRVQGGHPAWSEPRGRGLGEARTGSILKPMLPSFSRELGTAALYSALGWGWGLRESYLFLTLGRC